MTGTNLLKRYKKGLFWAGFFIILFFHFLLRWYHSWGVGSVSYASGDAYGIILKSLTLNIYKEGYYLISYLFVVFKEITNTNLENLAFILTPIISAVLLLLIYYFVYKKFNLIAAFFASLMITLNPWVAMYSTDVSKEIFVIFFFLFSIFYLFKFKDQRDRLDLFLSFILFSFGSLFYHSIFLFLPIYLLFLIMIIFDKQDIKKSFIKFIKYLIIFIFLFLIISGFFYFYQEIKFKEGVNQKISEGLDTESAYYGNFLESQFFSMISAIAYDRDKLGYEALKNGLLNNYLFGESLFLILFCLTILFSMNYKNNLYIFVLLTIYIFLIISLQWTSSSHGSRYPQYIIYFYFISIGIMISRLINFKLTKRISIFVAFALFIILFINLRPFEYTEGLRHIYVPQLQVGQIMHDQNVTIDQNHQVMLMYWPAITFSIMREYNLNDTDLLHPFGWGAVNLTSISSREYILQNKITYFIYDHTGNDYFNSSEIVLENLNKTFDITLIQKTDRNDLFVSIYQIKDVKLK
ncbi:MAG: glycosyltransferase family 39 protein [Candidatus Omnitrophota bacterium]|nr:glycosyltransferase family 39 protein [Candidatus Omnitrophota bacterium]